MGSIGRRWKGSNVRSRAVLIARTACAYAPRSLGEGGRNKSFLLTYIELHCPLPRNDVIFPDKPVPLFLCHVTGREAAPRTLKHCRTPMCGGRRRPPVDSPRTARRDRPAKDPGGHGGGAHPFPFRTGKLSPPAPMVLPKGGRVGCRLTSKVPIINDRDLFLCPKTNQNR